jgi:hypothetical protein
MQADVPGVGRYSAGAICSIAYGERAPVVSTASRHEGSGVRTQVIRAVSLTAM